MDQPEAPTSSRNALQGEDEPGPVLHLNPAGTSRLLLLADHAGNHVPRRLGSLGVAADDLADHIGIDIGVWALTERLAHALDAEAIGQACSRLVIDCNRRPGTPASIPETSDGRLIPGNAGLTEDERSVRVAEIFARYHDSVAARIAVRRVPPVLVAVHSFTRTLGGVRRDVDIGIIHGPDGRMANILLGALAEKGPLRIGRNIPYSIDFSGDYTLPVHGEAGGLDYVEIEVCQDLIATSSGQDAIAALLAPALAAAVHDSAL